MVLGNVCAVIVKGCGPYWLYPVCFIRCICWCVRVEYEDIYKIYYNVIIGPTLDHTL